MYTSRRREALLLRHPSQRGRGRAGGRTCRPLSHGYALPQCACRCRQNVQQELSLRVVQRQVRATHVQQLRRSSSSTPFLSLKDDIINYLSAALKQTFHPLVLAMRGP